MKFAIMSMLLIGAINCQGAIIEPKVNEMTLTKMFNYQGIMPPIKDDRTGEIIKNDANVTDLIEPTSNQIENEAVCWNLIVEQSPVTFALQNKVLDELQADLMNLNIDQSLGDRINKVVDKMRSNMNEALNALKNESPEEYFDALFDTSENIIQMSSLIRDPKLDERVFLALVKAVSRLGRNNSALVQEFTNKCSFMHRSPRPKMMAN